MNDYQAGLKHNLEIIEVFNENYKMGNLLPELKGMELRDARKKIVEMLEKSGNLVNTEDYTHNVAKCERCKSTIEPKVSMQWFVSMKDLAKRAADSVRQDKTRFVPKRYEKQYFNWLDNIQDWCISRQLWWGHRIPAYYCEECGHINVSKTEPEKCEKCGSTHLHQDEDTLDTWFSSALWPFSTLGWPNKEAKDYKRFYPTNVLVTGFDIITFWVSRMMTQALEFTDVEPLKIRNFCYEAFEKNKKYDPNYFRVEDKWILNKFDKLVVDVTKNIDNYDLGIAIDNIYSFIWNEFCDWYIEMAKCRIYSENEQERVQVSDVFS